MILYRIYLPNTILKKIINKFAVSTIGNLPKKFVKNNNILKNLDFFLSKILNFKNIIF